jgi:hypothetical protein
MTWRPRRRSATSWPRKLANLRHLSDSRFLDVLTRPVFLRGVQMVKANRAAGHDDIPKEGWVYLDEALDDLFTQTSLAWNLETFHEFLVLAIVPILYKGKGKDPNVYNSHRPIWLLIFVFKCLEACWAVKYAAKLEAFNSEP